jgi:hypothetical protein
VYTVSSVQATCLGVALILSGSSEAGVFEYSIRRIRIFEMTKHSIRIRFVRIRIRIDIVRFDSHEFTVREFVHELFEKAFEYS